MKRVGLHMNYWNGTGAETDVHRLLELTASTGAEAMDFGTAAALLMNRDQRRAFAESAAASGIALTLNGGVAGADLSCPDADTRSRGIAECKRAIDAAADLGSSVWSGVIYAKWLDLPTSPFTMEVKNQMWARAVDSVRTLCDYAAERGVNICFEIVNRFEAYMITTAAEGLRFIHDVGRDNAQLLLDVFHMNIEEDRISDALRFALDAGKLGHLHASESNRRLPGLRPSDLPWHEILQTVANSAYDGSIILEPMVIMGSPAAIGFRTWRNMADDVAVDALIQDAKTSLNFLRRELAASV